MHDNVIYDVTQINARWLTTTLIKSGSLINGQVTALEIDQGHGNWSTNATLTASYSANAQGTLPQKLFLKMAQADSEDEDAFGDSEVLYYARDYINVENAPLVRCYDAAYSEKRKRYHLLLDDVSASHIVAAEKEPTLAYGLALAEGLAHLHARWWRADELSKIAEPIHDARHIRRFVEIAKPGVDHILRSSTAELAPHWPEMMRELFRRHPQAMIERAKDDNGFTLIHGDIGHHNILVPRLGDRPIYLIDRQSFNWSLTTWLGVYDIAYALVLDWTAEARQEFEIPILQRYHEYLIMNGIVGYAWETLYDDYRLCVAMCVYTATEYCRGGTNKHWYHVWLLMLQRSLTACDQLKCHELWRSF